MFNRALLSGIYSKERCLNLKVQSRYFSFYCIFFKVFFCVEIYTGGILTSLLFALFNCVYIVSQRRCLSLSCWSSRPTDVYTYTHILLHSDSSGTPEAGEGVLFWPKNMKHCRKEGKKSSFSESRRWRQISAINTLSTCV
jgi:hypothetical protein